MVIETSLYCGEAYWRGEPPPEDSKTDVAISKIRSLFEDGVPLYRKEDIQGLDQQLQKVLKQGHTTAEHTVAVKGLDGIAVQFDIESGRILLSSDRSGIEMVLGTPLIYYPPIQELTSRATNYIPRIAYCNVRFYHYIETRNKHTKEPVKTARIESLDVVEHLFRTAQHTWEASKACKQLRSIFESMEILADIANIIAFACGSMAYAEEHQETSRSAFQHALLLTLQDVLSKKLGNSQISSYVQDPGYTKLDELVLGRQGIGILNDPKAFLLADESSVIISCAPSIPVKHIVSDLTRPAMMIWDRVDDENHFSPSSLDPDSPRLRKLIHDFYDCITFPEDLAHFSDLVIYVRRPGYRQQS